MSTFQTLMAAAGRRYNRPGGIRLGQGAYLTKKAAGNVGTS